MKVMTIVGTRPEIIKLSRVIPLLDQSVNHVLVHTGQNYDYELNEVFFKDLELRKPDHFLNAAGTSAVDTIAKVISESDKVFEIEKPDALLVYGDTNSCLSVISAKKRKIPIFHMEAGNRCFDQRVPEEVNRKIVDHLSDINMPLSEHARQYLIREGIPAERIIKTGSSMKEVFKHFLPKIKQSKILNELKLHSNDYFLVSIHREENVDYPENFMNVLSALNLLAEKHNKTVLVSTHPRTQKKLNEMTGFKMNSLVQFLKPFGFLDYNFLQMNALCVISDSGTITEEASILKMPAITIRNAHERPEGMDAGTLIMAGTQPTDILSAVDVSLKVHMPREIDDYRNEYVSEQVLKIILSYTHYVNRFVWRKMI